MTEKQKLLNRLFNSNKELKNFSVFPGDNPKSVEDLCREINKALDQKGPDSGETT